MMAGKGFYLFLLTTLCLFLLCVLTAVVCRYYALEYYLLDTLKGNYLFTELEGIKAVAGDYAWIQADNYLHGGASDIARKCRGLNRVEEGPVADIAQHDQGLDFFQSVNQAITLNQHIHLSGPQAKEILPWFRLATLLNPHNVEAYVDGAHWLAVKFSKIQQARKFLEEGRENNPDNYQIYKQFAFLAYQEGNTESAIDSLNKSIDLWKDADDPNVNERAAMYGFLGDIYEKAGDYTQALGNYQKVLDIIPGEPKIKEKVAKLLSQAKAAQ